MGQIIEEYRIDTAQGLVDALSPFNSQWGGVNDWIFRGHRDDAWKLVPSAMRDNAFTYHAIGVKAPYDIASLADQVRTESEVVFDFASCCLDAGLPLPEDGQWLRNARLQDHAFHPAWRDELVEGIDVPFPLFRSLYALAQHHGVPTRLLDWSRSPFTAAYFACAEVAKSLAESGVPPKDTRGENIAVYALRRLAFDYLGAGKHEPSIVEVEAPYAENPNLRAQLGTFTLLTYGKRREPSEWKLPPMEDVLREWCAKTFRSADADEENFPFVRKFVLPLGESRRLMRLLRKANVWAPTVWPNYDKAREGMRERFYWK